MTIISTVGERKGFKYKIADKHDAVGIITAITNIITTITTIIN